MPGGDIKFRKLKRVSPKLFQFVFKIDFVFIHLSFFRYLPQPPFISYFSFILSVYDLKHKVKTKTKMAQLSIWILFAKSFFDFLTSTKLVFKLKKEKDLYLISVQLIIA